MLCIYISNYYVIYISSVTYVLIEVDCLVPKSIHWKKKNDLPQLYCHWLIELTFTQSQNPITCRES